MDKKPRSAAELLGDDPAPPKARGGRSANPHRDELFIQQARIARLKADQLAGKLVALADVERQWSAAIIDTRQRLLAIPARMGAKLGFTQKQIAALEKELRSTLEALASAGGKPSHAGKP